MSHKNQIRWACRRGMLELDQFLLIFCDDCYDDLPPQNQQAFVLLLESHDQDLYNWLLGVSAPPDEFKMICEEIRSHAQRTL